MTAREAVSNGNDIDMEPCAVRQGFEVIRVGGEQDISIRCEQDQCGVQDVIHSRPPKQNARSAPQRVIQSGDIQSREQPYI